MAIAIMTPNYTGIGPKTPNTPGGGREAPPQAKPQQGPHRQEGQGAGGAQGGPTQPGVGRPRATPTRPGGGATRRPRPREREREGKEQKRNYTPLSKALPLAPTTTSTASQLRAPPPTTERAHSQWICDMAYQRIVRLKVVMENTSSTNQKIKGRSAKWCWNSKNSAPLVL